MKHRLKFFLVSVSFVAPVICSARSNPIFISTAAINIGPVTIPPMSELNMNSREGTFPQGEELEVEIRWASSTLMKYLNPKSAVQEDKGKQIYIEVQYVQQIVYLYVVSIAENIELASGSHNSKIIRKLKMANTESNKNIRAFIKSVGEIAVDFLNRGENRRSPYYAPIYLQAKSTVILGLLSKELLDFQKLTIDRGELPLAWLKISGDFPELGRVLTESSDAISDKLGKSNCALIQTQYQVLRKLIDSKI